jgi:hypothetical protein
MTYRRSLDWSSAIRDMRAASQVSPFLTAAGKFNLKAIMTAAIAEARVLGRTIRGLSWQARIGIALKPIWAKAKRALTTLRPVTRLAA